MKEPIISIIVPVYNTEKYLHKCLDSILCQSFYDFELILIDDGSKDSSGSICAKYAKIDERIKVVHKENEGVSQARNLGIEMAKGKYIAFVDSDDFIEPDMFNLLYMIIKDYNADIAVCGFYKIDEKYNNVLYDEIQRLNTEKALSLVLNYYNEFSPSVVNKLFNKNLIVKHRIRFNRQITMGEDLLFTCKCIYHSSKIVQSYSAKYHYRKNDSSATRMAFNLKKMTIFDSHDLIYDYIYSSYPSLTWLVRKRDVDVSISYIHECFKNNFKSESVDKVLRKKVSNNLSMYLFNKETNLQKKVYAILIAIQPSLLYFIWKNLRKI
jgi:glycosyltransferase involved in cell wall biosynthesis